MPEKFPLLKAALIGCGKIGWAFQDDPGAARFGICTHAAAWSAIEGVELASVADAVPASAQQCARRWQVPAVYHSLESMLEGTAPDIVSIATPDDQHFAGIKRCLEHPSVRAVLAEKPLATTAAEAEELVALAQRMGKFIMVNYSRRFCDFYVALRERIRSGEFGTLRLARNVYTKGARHNGSHFIDLMRFFFGPLQPKSATMPSWLGPDGHDHDPGLDVRLVTRDGACVVMHNLPPNNYTVFEMDLCFEKARFIFTEGGDTVQEFALVKDQPFAGYTSLTQTAIHQHTLRDYLLRAAENVVAVLRHNAPCLSPASESVVMLQNYENSFGGGS